MFAISEIILPEEKSNICDSILHALPNWFGIEKSIVEYILNVMTLPFYAAVCESRAIGFVALKTHNKYTAELHVMGVLPEAHRKGIGQQLVETCISYCKNHDIEYLTVKTLDESREDEGYEKTRKFYLSQGFRPLEVFSHYWDETNPCLFMAMKIDM